MELRGIQKKGLTLILAIFLVSQGLGQILVDSLVHPHTVYGIDVSSNGRKVFTAGKDSLGRMWNREGEILQTFSGHNQSVSSIDYLESTQTVLTGDYDSLAILWDLQGEILAKFVGHEDAVIRVHQHDTYIMTASRDHTAGVWDRKGNLLFLLKGHTAQINDIQYVEELGQFITISFDKTLKIWTKNGKLIKSFSPIDSGIRSLAISGDNKSILTGHRNGFISILDFEGNILSSFQAHESMINDIKIINDKYDFLSCGADGFIKFWSITGANISSIKAHNSYVSGSSVSGNVLLTSSGDQTAKIWDIGKISSKKSLAFTCANDGFLLLEQILGTWKVKTRDRTSPGKYEDNTGAATISPSIHGCSISIRFLGSFKGKSYARATELVALDNMHLQMLALDSEHGAYTKLEGEVKEEYMEFFWYRDKEKKRLQSKYILRIVSKDNFEFSSFLSTDYGKSWALTHQREFSRK